MGLFDQYPNKDIRDAIVAARVNERNNAIGAFLDKLTQSSWVTRIPREFIQNAMGMTGAAMGGAPAEELVPYATRAASDLAGAGVTARLGLSGLGLGKISKDVLGTFAGPLSKKADIDALLRAEEMERSGATVDDIRMATGWERGAEGAWKYEIDDSLMHVKTPGEAAADLRAERDQTQEALRRMKQAARKQKDFFPDLHKSEIERLTARVKEIKETLADPHGPVRGTARVGKRYAFERGKGGRERGIKAKYLVDHPELFGAYPELGEIVMRSGERLGEARARTSHLSDGSVEFSFRDSPAQQPSSLLHEFSHPIQDIEGFAQGASAGYIRDHKDPVVREAYKKALDERLQPVSFEEFKKTFREEAERRGFTSQRSDDELLTRYEGYKRDVAKVREQPSHPFYKEAEQEAAFDVYRSHGGEAEARNVQSRRTLSAASRRRIGPQETEDTPRSDQVITTLRASQQAQRDAARRPVRGVTSRVAPFPGIWEDPVDIARAAEAKTEGESPWLNLLFGTSRGELSDIARGRRLDTPPVWTPKAGAGGSKSARAVMTPANAERLRNQLAAFEQYAPNMTEGMSGWYITDPMYNQLVEMFGPAEGERLFLRKNATGFMSPATDVATEINRGTGFTLLDNLGLHDEFVAGGLGKADKATGAGPWRDLGFPFIKSHAYHGTAQAPNMSTFLQGLQPGRNSPFDPAEIIAAMRAQPPDPKVPLYVQSSLTPELGQQTRLPVPDAHFSRALGLADVRNWVRDYEYFKKTGRVRKVPNADHMKSPEYTPLGPWFYENVARPSGFEGVPAQATMWGGFGHATGVDTMVGAPKLELFANNVARRFRELEGHAPSPSSKADIKKMRDLLKKIYKEEEHATLQGGMLSAFG